MPFLSGNKHRRGPMTEAEKEMHRQRMLGNKQAAGRKHSLKTRQDSSARMKANNPMRRKEVATKMVATKKE